MELGINGKVAVVAASSKGLGKACALELSKEGAKVVVFSRNKDDIENTATEIQSKTNSEVVPLTADVTKTDQINSVITATLERFSTIHILVNNAGGPPFGHFDDFTINDWQSAVELNLYSTINLTNLVLPYMKSNNWGRIINITSVAVKQPIDGLILSNTVRSGVIGLAKTLSNELAEHNITVNNVCPGRILTNRIIQLARQRSVDQSRGYQEIIEDMEKDIPMGRLGDPDELGSVVTFLASEKASYVTGTTIQVDGGLLKGLY